jgi:hypothetical protein
LRVDSVEHAFRDRSLKVREGSADAAWKGRSQLLPQQAMTVAVAVASLR